MYLYESYCYPDLQTVADVVSSGMYFPNGAFISGYSINAESITFNTDGGDVVYTPPGCSVVGHAMSFTGITVDESIEVAWGVAAVLLAAWAIVIIRRAL